MAKGGGTTSTSTSHRGADAYSRLSSSSSLGRGSSAGWTTCPLCPHRSSKRFALGRGIAAHLHAVHAPWLPLSKKERKRREAERKRVENLQLKGKKKRKREDGMNKDDDDTGTTTPDGVALETGSPKKEREIIPSGTNTDSLEVKRSPCTDGWTPTQDEIEEWGRRVAAITAQVEADAAVAASSSASASAASSDGDDVVSSDLDKDIHDKHSSAKPPPSKKRRIATNAQYVAPGMDRTGGTAIKSYRDSLPPLLAAAADGNLKEIKSLLGDFEDISDHNNGDVAVTKRRQEALSILNQRDRNGSTAEHWAAGGGHLQCLKLLHRCRRLCEIDGTGNDAEANEEQSKKIRRRRDGKTPLHYAARNGRDEIIQYLLEKCDPKLSVDVPTGDGTTPLHLACFSAHLSTAKFLVEKYGANPTIANEWGCNSSHWVAMSPNTDSREVVELCKYLKKGNGISFHRRQKQGHSAVHKAAQKKNEAVIRWLATADGAGMTSKEKEEAGHPDAGGNKPCEIWESVGGDPTFSSWMRSECGW